MNFIYHVDDKQYTFPTDRATGSQIKSRIPYYNPSYLLVLERSGTNDLVVNNNDYVGLSPPTRFYTVPPATFSSLRPSNGEVEAMAKRLDGYRALCGLSEIGSVIEGAAALLRKLSAGESGGWQPIESAPKDGKRMVEVEAASASSEADRAALTRCLETQRKIEAENARLRRALKPFATEFTEVPEQSDDAVVQLFHTRRDLRRARAALAAEGGET